jgi:hypothetical protein
MLPLPVRLELSVKLLRSIDACRDATGDQGIGSAVERDILDRELAELALDDESGVARSPKPFTNTLTSEGPPGKNFSCFGGEST